MAVDLKAKMLIIAVLFLSSVAAGAVAMSFVPYVPLNHYTPYISSNISSLVSYANVPYNGFSPVYGVILNGSVLSEVYLPASDPMNYSCTPRTQQVFQNELAVANVPWCEVGAKGDTLGAAPEWIEVPAFTGLSVFGNTFTTNDSSLPKFENRTVITDCGGGYMTTTMCLDHPNFLYSPYFARIERLINITNGTAGMPEGVLPGPAHDHLINDDENGQFIGWYLVNILVFDPNIFPNPMTGKCTQVVNSSLENATGNCLTSLSAIANAMTTNDSAIASINANNPLWIAAGKPTTEIVIPNDTVSTLNQSNSNVDVNFSVQYVNPYTGTRVPDNDNDTEASAPSGGSGAVTQSKWGFSSAMPLIVGGIIVAVIVISVAFYIVSSRRRGGAVPPQTPPAAPQQ